LTSIVFFLTMEVNGEHQLSEDLPSFQQKKEIHAGLKQFEGE